MKNVSEVFHNKVAGLHYAALIKMQAFINLLQKCKPKSLEYVWLSGGYFNSSLS